MYLCLHNILYTIGIYLKTHTQTKVELVLTHLCYACHYTLNAFFLDLGFSAFWNLRLTDDC